MSIQQYIKDVKSLFPATILVAIVQWNSCFTEEKIPV